MTRTLRNLRAAREEFAGAVKWYEEQRSGLGADLFDAVSATTARIEAHHEQPVYSGVSEDLYRLNARDGGDQSV